LWKHDGGSSASAGLRNMLLVLVLVLVFEECGESLLMLVLLVLWLSCSMMQVVQTVRRVMRSE